MNIRKKIIVVVSLIMLILSLLIYIVFSIFTHIKVTKDLYNDLTGTVETFFYSFNKSFSEFKKAKSQSYTVNVDFESITSLPFSKVTLSNNYDAKYYELSIDNLNLKGKNSIDLNAFVTKDKIGFYFDENPEFCYTAKGDKFRSKWNSSMYGKIAKIPSFVPENINYNKLNTIMLPKNIIKIFFGMGLGKEKINITDIVNNISVSSPKPYIVYENTKKKNAQIAHLTISKDYIEIIVNNLKKSSENASFSYLNAFFENVNDYLKDSTEKSFKIDFVVLNNKLLWAETSVKLSSGITNLKLNFDYNEISFIVNHLKPYNSKNSNCILKFSVKSPSNINLQFVKGNKQLFSFNIHKNDDSTVTSEICYYNKKSKPQFIIADYFPESQKSKINIPTKNIYSLSVSDLLKLYSKINSRPNFGIKSFSFS